MENFPDNKNKDGKEGLSRRDFLKVVAGAGATLSSLGAKAEVQENSNPVFDTKVQKEILQQVAEYMNVKIDADRIPIPIVVSTESVSDQEFNEIIGFDTEGKRLNIFHPPRTILLLPDSKIHNLAHEITHYIQHNYEGNKDRTSDQTEKKAGLIQNKFRDYKQIE